MQESDALVLEIFRQGTGLAMSIFEKKELASTVRHYGHCEVSFREVNKLCQETLFILNKANKKGALDSDLMRDLKNTGGLLWSHLLTRSVREKLKTTQISDLVLSLDEELISIPWELFHTGEDFLCLKFSLGRVVRTKAYEQPPQYRSVSGTLKMLILANPTADLKSSYLEGLHIKNRFERRKNDIRIDFKSTHIDTLYVNKNLRNYDIVHFAGHCEYDSDNPKNTGWVLSDGRFTAQEILALGESSTLPSLVFSNACFSARVAPDLIDREYQEKNYSLAASFLFSGVMHYIGTIYKIEDPVSLAFAQEFYSQLIRGESIGECVRLARLRLIREYGYSAIQWTSYLLYGDPNFVMFRSKQKPKALKPATAIKPPRSKYKKTLIKLLLALSVVAVCICLYLWLPTLNPSVYLLYAKSKKYFLVGNNQEAIVLCKQVIEKEPLFLDIYPLIADAYRREGNRQDALKYYFDYALYSEKKQDRRHLVSAYIRIGWFYHLDGEYDKAFDFYDKALVLSKTNKDKLNEADVLGRLAVWYMDKGENDRALEFLTKSSEINRDRQRNYKHRYNLACDYFNLGLLFTNKDDYKTAKEFYDKSFNLFSRLKLTYELSDYYFNIGEIYSFQKEYQKALDYYSQGLKIDQEQGNKLSIASDYNMIGELYVEMDNIIEAENFFNLAVSTAEGINARPELATAYYNLGLLYKKQTGKKSKARDCLRKAQEIFRQINSPEFDRVKQALLNLD